MHCLYTMHIMGKRCSGTIFIGAIDQPFQNQVLDTCKFTRWTEDPVWVDQRPLGKEQLLNLKPLMEERLSLGHISPSSSPWNTPIFCIPKQNGKWRLLQDLGVINAIIEPTAALQPGLPPPTIISLDKPLVILDLKNFFYHSSTSWSRTSLCLFCAGLIHTEPMKRFHWPVLPQGRCNSPAICQRVVNLALQPVCHKFPTAAIYHYMDDILQLMINPFYVLFR